MFVGLPFSQTAVLAQIEPVIGLGRANPARLVSFGPSGLCYWNCDAYIAQHGGTIVYGWQIHGIRSLFFKLMHHAVVATENGSLLDPTELASQTGDIAFIPDNSVVPSRDYPPYIPNKFFSGPKGKRACETYERASNAQFDIQRRLVALAKSQGVPFVPGLGLRFYECAESEQLGAELERSKLEIDKAIAFCRAELRSAASVLPDCIT
jgi:hypothetical protein